MLADALAQEERVARSDLVDTVHIKNVDVPGGYDTLNSPFGVRSLLVGSGGFILGLNRIANRFCSGDLFLSGGVLTPNRRGSEQDKGRSGDAIPKGIFHGGILFAGNDERPSKVA
jgi:hypothetical protein